MMLKNKKGFTLIELLVVISIISLLSSIVFASLSSARSAGRDSARIQTLIQIRNAIELYRSDYGFYPVGNALVGTGDTFCTQVDFISPFSLDPIPGLIPNYISSFSTNLNTNPGVKYIYCSNKNHYYYEEYQVLENPISTNSTFIMPDYLNNNSNWENRVAGTLPYNSVSPIIYSDREYAEDPKFNIPGHNP